MHVLIGLEKTCGLIYYTSKPIQNCKEIKIIKSLLLLKVVL